MTVDSMRGARFKQAVEFLSDGWSLDYRGLVVAGSTPGELLCIVRSSWDLGQINEETARDDFSHGESVLKELMSDASFEAFARGRTVKWELIYDYRTGAIGVCQRVDGRIEWLMGPPAS